MPSEAAERSQRNERGKDGQPDIIHSIHNKHSIHNIHKRHKTKAKTLWDKINYYRKGRATTNTEFERLYNLAEIEKILGVTRQTLLNYIKSGQLQAVKIGGKWKVRKEALEKCMLGFE